MHAHGVRGYTLIELLTTLSVAAIIGSLSVGAFAHLTAAIQQSSAIHSAITSLNRTRYLAVKRNERVGLCSISEDNKCSPTWGGRYLAGFVDKNQNRKMDENEEIIFHQAWNRNLSIRWDDRFTNSAVVYQPNGTVVSNGTIYLSNSRGEAFAELIVNNYGRFRTKKY